MNHDKFIQIVQKSKNISPERITFHDKIYLYGLYQQAMYGNNHGPKPWFFQFEKYEMWKSWMDNKNMTPFEAKAKYVAYVESFF